MQCCMHAFTTQPHFKSSTKHFLPQFSCNSIYEAIMSNCDLEKVHADVFEREFACMHRMCISSSPSMIHATQNASRVKQLVSSEQQMCITYATHTLHKHHHSTLPVHTLSCKQLCMSDRKRIVLNR